MRTSNNIIKGAANKQNKYAFFYLQIVGYKLNYAGNWNNEINTMSMSFLL